MRRVFQPVCQPLAEGMRNHWVIGEQAQAVGRPRIGRGADGGACIQNATCGLITLCKRTASICSY